MVALELPGLEMPVVVCEMSLTVPVDHGAEIEEFWCCGDPIISGFDPFIALVLFLLLYFAVRRDAETHDGLGGGGWSRVRGTPFLGVWCRWLRSCV